RLHAPEDIQHLCLHLRFAAKLGRAHLTPNQEVAQVRRTVGITVRVRRLEEAEEIVADLSSLARLQLVTTPFFRNPDRVYRARPDQHRGRQRRAEHGTAIAPEILSDSAFPRLPARLEGLTAEMMIDVPGKRFDRPISCRAVGVNGGSRDDIEILPGAAG